MTDTAIIEYGCYSEGHRGIYAIERLWELVGDFDAGNDRYVDDGAIIAHHLHGDQDQTITISTGQEITRDEASEIVHGELYDELTELLPTEPGSVWIWNGGELFYWPEKDIDENGEIIDA